jgi:hypothetical protein
MTEIKPKGKGKNPKSGNSKSKSKSKPSKAVRFGGPKNNLSSEVQNVSREYLKTLADPWQYANVKLGWGCMVPSRLAQVYLRGVTTANADGSLALAPLPDVTTGLFVFAGGAASVSASSNVVPTDSAAIQANFNEARIVSMGIKAYPVIAATSVPGVCYAGSLTGMTDTILNGLCVNDFASFPTSTMFHGAAGASATGRPVDPTSFQFQPEYVDTNGWAASANNTTEIPFSIPYVAFLGLPNGASVAYELCINLEGVQKLKHSAAPLGIQDDNGPTLSKYFPSADTMWNVLKKYMPMVSQPGTSIASNLWNITRAIMGGSISGKNRALPRGRGGALIEEVY